MMTNLQGQVYLGLGANLGNRAVTLSRAVDALGALGRITGVSSLYRSEPVGYHKQPEFANMVCSIKTQLSPCELLERSLEVEAALGRIRSIQDGPRVIDIDLLGYDMLVLDLPDLVLPHPRLHRRAFVLVPLMEIAPSWRHPLLQATPAEMLAAAGPLERVERLGFLAQLTGANFAEF